MKNLFLLRHGKSSWKYTELTDFERPLNERGRRDISLMTRVIGNLNIKFDKIVSSPATRAYFSARSLAYALEYPLENLETDELIYESGLDDLLKVVKQTNNSISSLLIAGHNPGLTVLSNTLSNKYIDNIPTFGFVHISLEIDSWSKVSADCGELVTFEYPKKHLE